jgi:hypothetical protein
MIFGLTKFRTAGETQDTRFFELEFSWLVRSFNGTKWVNRHSSLKLQTSGGDFMRVLAISALACALVPGLSATAETRSMHDKLRSCLELKDMTKQRLDCYDAVLPPQQQPNPMPLPAKVVTDCRFSKDENERLICFNQFAEKPAEPVAPKATSAAPKPVEPTAVVPSAGTTGARTR